MKHTLALSPTLTFAVDLRSFHPMPFHGFIVYVNDFEVGRGLIGNVVDDGGTATDGQILLALVTLLDAEGEAEQVMMPVFAEALAPHWPRIWQWAEEDHSPE